VEATGHGGPGKGRDAAERGSQSHCSYLYACVKL
jgi:hypothetical protein